MAKIKLTVEEQDAYRKKQQERIKDQQNKISEILATNQDIRAIQQILSTSNFRPEAYITIPNQDSPERQIVLDQQRINARIKSVKTGKLEQIGGESKGATDSVLVTKASEPESSKAPKHYNTWIKKTGDVISIEPNAQDELIKVISPESEGRGEVFCEYIGTNLSNEIMGNNSPKVRLYRDASGKITLMSKFINDAKGDQFQTIQDMKEPITEALEIDDIRKIKGFTKLFVATALFGDNDGHGGNIGIRKTGDSYHWARIDNGKSLSYNVKKRFGFSTRISYSKTSQTATDFKENMLSTEIYPKDLFQGLDFANELTQEVAQLNPGNLRYIITKSMENLKAAYRENYLEDPEISKSLRQRMGFSASEPLTEEILANKIMENITRLKGELEEMAREEFKTLFPKNPDGAAKAYADAMVNGELNNDAFLANLEAANIDITKSEDFDPTYAKEKMPPSLIEDLTRTVATTATPDQALIFAIKLKDEYYTQTLLNKGANLNAQDHNGKSALTLAIENGSLTTAKDLIKRGATADQDSLISAFEKSMTEAKDPKLVQELIENTLTKAGDQNSLNQAFLLSIKLNLKGYAQELLTRGADINAKDKDDSTALMLASKNIMPEIATTLIGRGAKINGTNKHGQSALSLAVAAKIFSGPEKAEDTSTTINLLFAQPTIDVSAKNNGNFPLVYYITSLNRTKDLYKLIAAGAGIDQPGPDGTLPLEMKSMFSSSQFSDFTKRAIDENNFKAVNSFIDLNKRLCLANPLRNKEILIGDQSLLKYALTNNKPLAFNMIEDKVVGFSKEELKINPTAQEILKTKNFFRKLYKPFNKDDLIKIAILTPANNVSHDIKSSPLKLAIDTKQFELAEKMINSGYSLKKSELSSETDIKSGSLIKRMFGIASKTKLREFSTKALDTAKQPQANVISARSASKEVIVPSLYIPSSPTSVIDRKHSRS